MAPKVNGTECTTMCTNTYKMYLIVYKMKKVLDKSMKVRLNYV